jgi:hypothetical protein
MIFFCALSLIKIFVQMITAALHAETRCRAITRVKGDRVFFKDLSPVFDTVVETLCNKIVNCSQHIAAYCRIFSSYWHDPMCPQRLSQWNQQPALQYLQ